MPAQTRPWSTLWSVGVLLCMVAALASAQAQLPSAQAQQPLQPSGVAYDAVGNLYFADTNRQQVFESTLAGKLVVVAGSGTQGFAGDGGPATAAALNNPTSVAVGSDGTLYIADTGNERIRAVQGDVIATFVGTGAQGFAGDGGAATGARFDHPTALAIDASGALLVADAGNQRVRRIASGSISTIAGSGVQGFGGDGGAATAALLDTPSGLAVGPDGSVYIADTHNQRVRRVSPAGTITTVAGTGSAGFGGDGGSATAAELASPRGLFVAQDGTLLIADSNNQRIRSVSAQGGITTIAGSGVQGSSLDAAAGVGAALNTPRAVTVSSFNAAVFADTGNALVRELITNQQLYVPAGLAAARVSVVSLAASPQVSYGAPLASVTVVGSVSTPQGGVALFADGAQVAQASLQAGAASFSGALMPVGAHMLTAQYLGDGVNPAATSAAVATTVSQATSLTTETLPAAASAGTAMTVSVQVVASTSGTPTGSVTLLDNGTQVAAAPLTAGGTVLSFVTTTAGSHSLVSRYSGDANFLPSSSSAATVVVGALPDFALSAAGSTTVTVQAGSVASYTFSIASAGGAFNGAVSLGVTGLPTGVQASFAPPQLVPGTTGANTVLSLQTSATMLAALQHAAGLGWALLLVPVWLLARGRRAGTSRLALLLIVLSGAGLMGCGDRTLPGSSQGSQTYALTVTATGTNAAGALLVHSVPITLIVQ